MYTCTCRESLIHATVCKHSHVAHIEKVSEEAGLCQIDMESFLEQFAEDGDVTNKMDFIVGN